MARIRVSKQMCEEVRDKDPGWLSFLERWGLQDDRMTEEDAYRRYLKFKDVTFGEAPEHMWKECYQSLLPLERGLVYGDAIGEVAEFEFRFDVTDPTPIREKPLPYKKEERQWVRNYIKN